MKVTQKFRHKADKKHSVVYAPASDSPENPAITSGIYVSRLVLPLAVKEITLTIEAEGLSVPKGGVV